jgi:23S rRNA (uracil1939-C5)-methyltransferase
VGVTPLPLKKNAVIPSLLIESVNAKGFGVGRMDSFVLLVDGALPGDRLEARVVKVKARYGYAKTLRIITPSPHRIESPCPVSAACGGCQFRHCEYTAQLAIKKRIVVDAFVRIGGIEDPPVADVIGGMTDSFRYRNKGVFPVVPAPNADGFAMGMYASRSHRIVEIDDCLIQHPAHVRVLSVIKEYMRRHKIPPYDETLHKGLMRQIMVRTSLATGEVMVALAVNGESLPKEKALAETLTAKAGATTVLVSPHTARGNAVMGERFRVVSGSGYIEEEIGGVRYRISAPSFFQVNPVQMKTLYDAALEQLALSAGTSRETINIIDAHAGAGGIALYAAKHAARQGHAVYVVGVDIVAPAIEDAKVNAEINNIANAFFIAGASEDIIPALLSPDSAPPGLLPGLPAGIPLPFRPDAVFLDPPRRGCEPGLLDTLLTAKIPHIIYISCDPATLARDVKHLCAGGYRLITVQPVDMFPMTGHVEAIALLCRTDTK